MKTILDNFKALLNKYSHAWVFLYAFIYFPWFHWLEKNVTTGYSLVSSPLDNYIPFVEFFIVPYLLWFAYMAVTCFYFFFTCREEFYKFTKMCIIGMTLFLIICTVFPNGLRLRPTVFPRDNIFVDLVRFIYSVDTPTNVLPSLHVYTSAVIAIFFSKSRLVREKPGMKYVLYAASGLIILSTVFLKQHSVLDMIAGNVMAWALCKMAFVEEDEEEAVRKNRRGLVPR